ncbi:hypothetical protein K7472_11795 [Streptomyces sp. PTM05]|uniref:Uncharacterized protein n=1 Tax=Streptantibioticus parmotrematis TaxID=2873249 RepID=A0ABS7QRG2_9ACTN|nr:hypothetical protein [Streptantibioticus parmotrematis]MBY8885528.1 hypothetical protein [Streptantibioticus parmotrematis]
MWNRNNVLAEAFCRSDEHVRDAQGLLDEAQADRVRLLAAFSISVGSDGAVADMLGLAEREVRVARRTVGKDNARAVAEELLAAAPAPPPGAAGPATDVPAPPPSAAQPPAQAPGAASTSASGPASAASADWTAQAPAAGPADPFPVDADQIAQGAVWTPVLDTVLINSWNAEVDLETLSAQFGMDLTHIVKRVQHLFAHGLLAPPPGEGGRSGRHRRSGAAPVTEPEPTFPVGTGTAWISSEETMQPREWHPYPAHPAAPQGWDGVLTAWAGGTPGAYSTIPHQELWSQG